MGGREFAVTVVAVVVLIGAQRGRAVAEVARPTVRALCTTAVCSIGHKATGPVRLELRFDHPLRAAPVLRVGGATHTMVRCDGPQSYCADADLSTPISIIADGRAMSLARTPLSALQAFDVQDIHGQLLPLSTFVGHEALAIERAKQQSNGELVPDAKPPGSRGSPGEALAQLGSLDKLDTLNGPGVPEVPFATQSLLMQSARGIGSDGSYAPGCEPRAGAGTMCQNILMVKYS